MDIMKQAGTEWDGEHVKSRLNSTRKLCHVENHLVSQADDYKIVDKLVKKAADKLDNPVIKIGEKTVFDALKTRDAHHKKSFIKNELRSALHRFLVPIMDGLSVIRESYEDAIL